MSLTASSSNDDMSGFIEAKLKPLDSVDETTYLLKQVESTQYIENEDCITPKAKVSWWIWSILGCLSTFLGVLLALYTSQKMIDKSEFQILNVSISQATNSSFQLIANTHINLALASPLPISLLPTQADIYFQNKKLGHVGLPLIKLAAGCQSTEMEIKGEFIVYDAEHMAIFSTELIQSKTLSWTINSSLEPKILGVPVPWLGLRQKSMELRGMEGMSNVTISTISLPSNHPDGGIKILANATLFNPTTNTLAVGDVNYVLIHKGILLAKVKATNLQLVPGENSLSLDGQLLPQPDENIPTVSSFVSKFVQGQPIPVTVRGVGLDPPNSWLDEALQSHIVEMDYVNQVLNDFVAGIKVSSLTAGFDATQPFDPTTGATIEALIRSPFDFPINITRVSESMSLNYLKQPMAKMNPPTTNATTVQRSDSLLSIITQFHKTPLQVYPSRVSHRAFETFLGDVVFSKEAKVDVSGTIDATVVTSIGKLDLKGLPLKVPMSFPGLGGMQDPPPSLSKLEVTGIHGNKVGFKASAELVNPTPFSGSLGDISLKVQSQGEEEVGLVTLSDFNIKANATTQLQAVGWFELPQCKSWISCPTSQDYARKKFLETYITNQPIRIIGAGYTNSTDIVSLRPALSQLRYNLIVPPAPDELLQGTSCRLLKRAVEMDLINPFDSVTVRILGIHALATYLGSPIGQIDVDFTTPTDPVRNPRAQSPIILPPKSLVTTEPLPIRIVGLGWKTLKAALGGTLALNVTVKVRISLQSDLGNPVYLAFDKLNVSSQIRL